VVGVGVALPKPQRPQAVPRKVCLDLIEVFSVYNDIPDNSTALRNTWITSLQPWQREWFCTFTFREIVHPESADKRFHLFISMVNPELYGPRWHKKSLGVQWVRALEFQHGNTRTLTAHLPPKQGVSHAL
jgi:hypothetical protein